MKRTTFILGISVFMGSIFGAPTADAAHAWGTYHWARPTTSFTLLLGDNLTPNWDSYLRQTSTDWTTSNVLDTQVVAGNTNNVRGKNTPKNCAPTGGRGEICNAKYGSTGWLGIASIWASGDHITAGTVKLNDTYFSTATYNTAAWKNFVTCQEVGHLFGLAHQDEAFDNPNLNTCMDYTNSPESNQYPNVHDFEMLEQLYSHPDTTTTVKSAAVAMLSDTNNPAEWGSEVHRSANGRSSIFVQDLGNGNRVIRHVFWAEARGNNHR